MRAVVQIVEARDSGVVLGVHKSRRMLMLAARVRRSVPNRLMLVLVVLSRGLFVGVVRRLVLVLVLVVRRLVLVVRRLVLVLVVRRRLVLSHIRLRVLMRSRDRAMMVMPDLRVQRDVQPRPDLESDQPQRAQEQRVNSAKAAMSKERQIGRAHV